MKDERDQFVTVTIPLDYFIDLKASKAKIEENLRRGVKVTDKLALVTNSVLNYMDQRVGVTDDTLKDLNDAIEGFVIFRSSAGRLTVSRIIEEDKDDQNSES